MNIYRFRRIVKDWFAKNFYYRFNPQQKWLTAKIPLTFCDKDWLFETTLFEGLIHFWEEDNGEESTRFQYEICDPTSGMYDQDYGSEAQKKERYELYRRIYFCMDRAYRWAKVRDQVWEDLYSSPWSKDAEENLNMQDTLFLTDIIHYRKYLWT